MKSMSLKSYFLLYVAFSFGIIATLVSSIAYAQWSSPSQQPPGGNVDAPIHVGAGTQFKQGSLGANELCLGSDCRTEWPAGGGGNSNISHYSVTYTGSGWPFWADRRVMSKDYEACVLASHPPHAQCRVYKNRVYFSGVLGSTPPVGAWVLTIPYVDHENVPIYGSLTCTAVCFK